MRGRAWKATELGGVYGGWLGVPMCLPVWAQLQCSLFLFPLPGHVILRYQELLAMSFCAC